MRYQIKMWLLVVILAGNGLLAGLAHADELETRLEDLRGRLDQQQTRINAASRKVENVSEQLRIIQAELDEAVAEYESIQVQRDDTMAKIELNTEVLRDAEERLDSRTKILSARVRDIYKNGQISYIDVLFGANDFSDFITRMELLKRVIRHDFNLIAAIQEERTLILAKRAELEKDKALLEDLMAQAEEQQRRVEAKKEEKEWLLDQAVNDREMAERVYQELLQASREVEQMIRRSRYADSGRATGAMMWPIIGEITSEYGWRVHPIFGTSKYHSGLDIAGDYGMDVVAADGGTVIYAGWISGYGNAVIIDHGGGLSTLYAHNDSLVVSEGQIVSKGQLIAYCGSTGYSTGPHVHFEVRINGEPTSPYDYLS